jgi:hypothetical protein
MERQALRGPRQKQAQGELDVERGCSRERQAMKGGRTRKRQD